MNVTQLIYESAIRRPEKPAVTFEGVPWTYAAFSRQIERYAGASTPSASRRVTAWRFSCPRGWSFCFFTLPRSPSGPSLCPSIPIINPRKSTIFSPIRKVDFSSPTGTVISARGRLRDIAGMQVLLVDGEQEGAAALSRALDAGAVEGVLRPFAAQGGETAMICYTSGTTGRSKGAMITHENLISNSRALAQAWQWTDQDRLLHVLPLFHVHGLNVAMLGSLLAGASVCMHEKFIPPGPGKPSRRSDAPC
jgi:malonyl-CoA/methylmalonyl-CoA synthetase